MVYYEIGVGVERHWKNASYTYCFDKQLLAGDLVRVPFGDKKKAGVILGPTKKPSFDTKPIFERLPGKLSAGTNRFMDWYKQFYLLDDGELYSQFLPSFITTSKDLQQIAYRKLISAPDLSVAQENAVSEIKSSNKPSVLRGITGSGKTRIYTSLIANVLQRGENALLLYPEISLTTQLFKELEKYATVLIFHSQLTNRQRSDLWLQVAGTSEPILVAGPRSSLFLPHKNLGIVIVDEAHDSSYKQETDVRYNGLFVAGGLAKAHEAKLVLGSATPPITETELLVKNGGSITEVNEKAIASKFARNINVINMKDPNNFKKHSLLSDPLLRSIDKNVKSHKQTLLFLNRRGTAKLLMCEVCDWRADCSDCDLPTTYHHDIHKLICHTCGKKFKVPAACPDCGSKTTVKSLGSKALVEEVKKIFPKASIARFDSDNSISESFHSRYEEVKDGKVDILIGTQQLTKGIDLPRLKTVGVLQADLSLNFPDYSSNERTFQLIAQVIGRVGRGHGDAEIFLQTFQPNNPVIQLAASEDWSTFRAHEFRQRIKHGFPPAMFTAKLIFRNKSFDKALKEAQNTKSIIGKKRLELIIDGPLPSFYAKRAGFYYVQLHLRAKRRSGILLACKEAPKTTIKDLDPLTLL